MKALRGKGPSKGPKIEIKRILFILFYSFNDIIVSDQNLRGIL